jgi:hypothetical protein
MNVDEEYLEIVKSNMPRILSLYDTEKNSTTYGLGDRNYWAWAQIDYPNATFQGIANGLSKLYAANLLHEFFSKVNFIEFLDSIFEGTFRILNKNGSLNESFPNEQSWCVTSLVAYDLLTALESIEKIDNFDRSLKLKKIAPMFHYMTRNIESHAFISNHLVTAAAGYLKWHDLTGDSSYEKEAERIVETVIESGGSEGWFQEYNGFDPGYQSITTQYLAEIEKLRPNWNLGSKITQSLEFMSNFFNPDGTFGGMIGSRQTSFFYPGGFNLLSSNQKLAARISNTAKKRIITNQIVNLSSIDSGNLIPLFNSYCVAALNPVDKQAGILEKMETGRKIYKESGIIIDVGTNHKTIVSLRSGGIVQHYSAEKEAIIDCGAIIKNKKGKLGTTQHQLKKPNFSIENSTIKLHSTIHQFARELPTPIKFALIRLFSVTIFRNQNVLNQFKKIIVRKLITKQKNWQVAYTREIHLGYDLHVNTVFNLKKGDSIIAHSGKFSPIHMASRGYWQIGNFNHDS